ncbi:AAA family ATPase, partial [Myxococcota bacterium]|nr:AAA family ATPase [Myxococcota bacterium]
MTGLDPLLMTMERRLTTGPAELMIFADVAIGGLHRLAWLGPDPQGDRARMHKYARSVVRVTAEPLPVVSAIIDWWRVVTFGVEPEGRAREVGAVLSGPTGAALQAFINLPTPQPLRRLRQSYAAKTMMSQLDAVLAEPVSLKVAPAARILGDARAECAALLRAARALEPIPTGLRVLALNQTTAQDWAETTVPEGALKRGSTVFHATVDALMTLRERVAVVLAGWPAEAPPTPTLPESWREELKAACGAHHELPAALVADLLPEPTTRPVFALNPRRCPELGDESKATDRVFLLGLYRESFEATKTPLRPWMRETLAQIEAHRKEVRALHAELGPLADDAARDAERHLDDLDLERFNERLSAMNLALSERRLHQSRQQVFEVFRRMEAQLRAQGEELPAEPAALRRPYKEAPVEAPPEEVPQRRRRRKGEARPLDGKDPLQSFDEAALAEAAPAGPTETIAGIDIDVFSDPSWSKAERERATRWARTIHDRFGAALAVKVKRLNELERALIVLQRELTDELEAIEARVNPEPGATPATLAELDALIGETQALVESLRAKEDPTLDDALRGLRDGLGVSPWSWGAMGLFNRLLARRALGLDVSRQREVILTLHERAKRAPEAPLAAICGVHEGALMPVVTVLGGAQADTLDLGPTQRTPDGVLWAEGEPEDAAERLAAWAWAGAAEDARRHPTRWIYVHEGRTTFVGPWRWTPAGLAPVLPTGEVLELEADVALTAQGAVALHTLGTGGEDADRGQSWLLADPLSLAELEHLTAPRRDGAGPGWVFEALHGGDDAAKLAAWLNDPTPPQAAARRLDRLEALMERAEVFEALRADTMRGSAAAKALRGELEVEAAAARAALEARLRAEHAASLSPLREALAARSASSEALKAEVAALHEELTTLDTLLGDPRLEVLSKALPGVTSLPPAAPPRVAPLRAEREQEPVALTLQQAIWRVAGHTWSFEDVANLLIGLLTGRWTLLAGLPGVGKSTFARSVLTRLGHGPATGRALELVVRRDWQDDAPLFGFWHPTERRWEPSSEGLLEQLLRARDDADRRLGGLYPVLIEELNLASPEHYLARLLSATEASPPRLRLYNPELRPENAARYPAAFDLAPATRLVATVNVDDTVERLSPRFLSRASVIWIEPRAGAPRWRPEDDLIDAPPVSLPALLASVDRPLAPLGELEAVIEHLRGLGLPGAPTRRTITAI